MSYLSTAYTDWYAYVGKPNIIKIETTASSYERASMWVTPSDTYILLAI